MKGAELLQLIDAPVDYSDNDRILNREIPALSKALCVRGQSLHGGADMLDMSEIRNLVIRTG